MARTKHTICNLARTKRTFRMQLALWLKLSAQRKLGQEAELTYKGCGSDERHPATGVNHVPHQRRGRLLRNLRVTGKAVLNVVTKD